jgi:protein RecA
MSKTLDDLSDILGSVIGGNDENQGVTDWIDSGYEPLNNIMSGDNSLGLPQGRLIEMFGPSSSGKTLLATMMMIEAQRAGGIAGFFDHERSFAIKLAKGLGLNDTKGWIYKQPKTWEESNTLMAKAAQAIRKAKIIPDTAPILFVFDSIAAAIPKSMLGKEMDELSMNDTTALARVTSTTLKMIASFAEEYNFTVLYLNQIRTKPGVVYGDPTTTPGGGAMEFYASVRIALGRKKLFEEIEGEKVFVGQEITMKATKNKVARPFQECKLRMMYDAAGVAYFDVTGSLLDYAISGKKLAAAGARVTWVDGKSYYRKALIKVINETGQLHVLKGLLAGLDLATLAPPAGKADAPAKGVADAELVD